MVAPSQSPASCIRDPDPQRCSSIWVNLGTHHSFRRRLRMLRGFDPTIGVASPDSGMLRSSHVPRAVDVISHSGGSSKSEDLPPPSLSLCLRGACGPRKLRPRQADSLPDGGLPIIPAESDGRRCGCRSAGACVSWWRNHLGELVDKPQEHLDEVEQLPCVVPAHQGYFVGRFISLLPDVVNPVLAIGRHVPFV